MFESFGAEQQVQLFSSLSSSLLWRKRIYGHFIKVIFITFITRIFDRNSYRYHLYHQDI